MTRSAAPFGRSLLHALRAPRGRRRKCRAGRRNDRQLVLLPLEDRTVPTAVAPGGDWSDNYNFPTVWLHNWGPGWLEVTGGGGHANVGPGAPPPPPDGGPEGEIHLPPPGGEPPPSDPPPTELSPNYAFEVTGYLGDGSGDVTWSGPAESLYIKATGDVDPVSIAGDVSIDAGWTVGTVSGRDVWVQAGKSIGNVNASDDVTGLSAGTSIGKVTAADDVATVSAGTSVGAVSAGGDVTSIWAGQGTSSVSAGGWLGSVSAGLDVGGSVTAGLWIGGAYIPGAGDDWATWYYANYSGGVSAGRDVVGSVTAGRGIVSVTAGRDVLGPVTASGGDIWWVHAGGGGVLVPSTMPPEEGETWVPYPPGRVAGAVTASRDVYAVVATGDVAGAVTAQGGYVYAVNADGSVKGGVTAQTDVGRKTDREYDADWRPYSWFWWNNTLLAPHGAGVIAEDGDVGVRVEAKTGDVAGPVAAGTDVTAKVTAAGDVKSVGAGRDVTGDVTAGRDVGTVFAGSPFWFGPIGDESEGGDVTGTVTAKRDIDTVMAGRDVRGDVLAGRDIESVWAGRSVSSINTVNDEPGPVTIEATAGHIRRVLAQDGIGAVITAGTHIGDPLDWPGDTELIYGDETVAPPYPVGGWFELPLLGYPGSGDVMEDTGVLAGGAIKGNIEAGGDVRVVTAGQRFQGYVHAGRDIGGVAGQYEVKGEVEAAGSVGIVASGFDYPVEYADPGNVRADVTATAGFVSSVWAWGGEVKGAIKAGTDVRSVWAGTDFTGSVEAASDVGDVRAWKGAISGPVTATKGDVGSVSAGTSITGDIKAGDDIWAVASGTVGGGGIKGSVTAADDIGYVVAYGATGEGRRPADLVRPEDPTPGWWNDGDELNRPLWTIDPATDLYLPGSLPSDRPAFPNLPIGGNIDAVIKSDGGDIGTVTAFGELKGEVTAAKTIGQGETGPYPRSGVWAVLTIESPVTAGEGSLGVRGWEEIKGNVTTKGDLQSWAYGNLFGDLTSTDGTIFAGSWCSLAGGADAKGWVDVRAFTNVGQPAVDPDAPAAGKTLKSATDAARVWAGQNVTSAVDADKYAAVYATKGVSIADGRIRSTTEDAWVLARDGDIVVTGESGFSGGVSAQDLAQLTAGRDIGREGGQMPVTSWGGDVVMDAGGAISIDKANAEENLWASARSGNLKGEHTSTDESVYLWAFADITGKATAKQLVSATGWGNIPADLTSTEYGVEVFAAKDLTGKVTAKDWIDIEAGGNVTGEVTAGDDGTFSTVSIRAGGNLSSPKVYSGGSIDAAAVGNVSAAEVTTSLGPIFLVANGDMAAIGGNISAQEEAYVSAGGSFNYRLGASEVRVNVGADALGWLTANDGGIYVHTGTDCLVDATSTTGEVVVEAGGKVVGNYLGGPGVSAVAGGNISGTYRADWVVDVRSENGVVDPAAVTATNYGRNEWLNLAESPYVKRLTKVRAERDALVAAGQGSSPRAKDLAAEIELMTEKPQVDMDNVDKNVLKEMRDNGLAYMATGLGATTGVEGYFFVADAIGGATDIKIFEPLRDGQPIGGQFDAFNRADNYRLVYHLHVLADPATQLSNIENLRKPDIAQGYVQRWREGQQTALENAVIDFGVHMIPLVSAMENFEKGNYFEAALDLAADVSTLVGFGAVSAGARCVVAGHRLAKTIKLASSISMGIDGGLAAISAGRGFQALFSEDPTEKQKAWGYFGDASLRLFGLSMNAIGYLRKRSCFVAGTPVHTERGVTPIERIQVGDQVWAFDPMRHQWVLAPVSVAFRRSTYEVVTLTLDAGDAVTGTPEHPFWVVEGEGLADRPVPTHGADEDWSAVPGRWVNLGDLRVGDVVLTRLGRTARVTAFDRRAEPQEVYNIEVADLRNYAVGVAGALTHNYPTDAGGGLVEEAAAAGRTRAVTKPTATNPAAGRAPEAGTKPSGAKKQIPAEGVASGEAAPTLSPATKSKYHRDRPPKSELPAGNRAQIEKPRPKPDQLDTADLDAVYEGTSLRDLIKQRQALDDAAVGIGAKGAASQKVGGAGADRYMRTRMPEGTTKKYPGPGGGTGNGNREFDSIWFDPNTQTYYVVEAKGWGGARRRTKKVGGTAERPIHAEQGSEPYFRKTLDDMSAPGHPGNDIADELLRAMEAGSGKKVVYMEVTTKLSGGKGPVFSTGTYKRWN